MLQEISAGLSETFYRTFLESSATFGGVVLFYLPGIGQIYGLFDNFPRSWRSVSLSWKYQPSMNEGLSPK